MTPQEAILRIKNHIEVHSRKEKHFAVKITEALKMAIEALEKQIPKRAILDVIFPSGIEWYLCPTCNHNNVEKSDSYCHACGQALDWSDTE